MVCAFASGVCVLAPDLASASSAPLWLREAGASRELVLQAGLAAVFRSSSQTRSVLSSDSCWESRISEDRPRFSSHSLKRTCLAFASKAGLSRFTRACLGRHVLARKPFAASILGCLRSRNWKSCWRTLERAPSAKALSSGASRGLALA